MRYFLLALALACAIGAWFVTEPAIEHYRVAHWVISPDEGDPGMSRLVGQPIQQLRDADFARLAGEDDRALMTRLNTLVHESTWHCLPTDYTLSSIEKGLLDQVDDPVMFENGIMVRERFSCGFCHQRASLLVQALLANGIEAAVLGLNGHVVAHVTLPGEKFYLDPDYGVGPLNGSEKGILDAYTALPYGEPEAILAMYQSTEDNGLYMRERVSRQISAQHVLFAAADTIAANKMHAGLTLLGLSVALAAAGYSTLRSRPGALEVAVT